MNNNYSVSIEDRISWQVIKENITLQEALTVIEGLTGTWKIEVFFNGQWEEVITSYDM